ncbi:longiborneol synthase [Astrocystis sublimbata]|nr:longiborneol synthase [Astrocystis sublimbata]
MTRFSSGSDCGQLAAAVRSVCVSMLEELRYEGVPKPSDQVVQSLWALMHEKAIKIGLPLDNPMSAKGFWLGFSEGLLPHTGHPVQVQAYIGLVTWLVVLYDDIVGQKGQMQDEAGRFHDRFFRGEMQPNALLNGIAELIREAPEHFDPVLSTLLQTSILHFLTSNLLEQRSEFKSLRVTKEGREFPYYFRGMSGMDLAYTVFTYPKALYPDIGVFIEAIPDMAKFTNISNDVLSFYKEELASDKRNYINNRAVCEGKDALEVLEAVKSEAVECARRIRHMLKGTGKYAQAFDDCVRGYMAMHTTNPRYRLSELSLGEEHPLAPLKTDIDIYFGKV